MVGVGKNGWSHLRMSSPQPCVPGPHEIHLLVLVVIIVDTVFFECAQ